jgi:cobaltochelatase CobN
MSQKETRQRNMVQRIDGRLVNAGAFRGMIMVCATGCCCGVTERGFAPVPRDLYHQEWERRKFRNRIHLNQGGCLGPCVLANVVTLLFDGRPYWFHSVNDEAIILAIYDFAEALLADATTPVPTILQPHIFNGFAWNGEAAASPVLPIAQPAQPIPPGNGILVLTQADTDLLTLTQARSQLPTDFAPVQAANVGRLPDDDATDALLDRLLPAAQIVVARLHSTRSFEQGLARLERWARESDGFLLCLPAVEAFDPDLMGRSNVGIPLAQAISAYFQCGGAQNLANGLLCLSDHLLITGRGFDPPQELPLHGVYSCELQDASCELQDARCELQDARCELQDASCELQDANGDTAATYNLQPATVGILFYRAHLLSGNTEFVDAIIAELARQGLAARVVYTQSLKECDADGMPMALKLMQSGGSTGSPPAEPIDAIISTLSFALGDTRGALEQIDVPIVQAITSSSDAAAWRRNGRGLSPLDTAMNVAIPEFDGRIISVPVSFKEETTAPDGHPGARYAPDPERIVRVVGLVKRLVTLRHKPNAEKRIAFVFTNSAAKAARVGNAVGLDAPASLLKLLHRMQEVGYTINGLPKTSDELLLSLIDRCSYDLTWLTDAQLARAQHLPVARYRDWFADVPESRRTDMIRQWGEPPGKAYIHNQNFALAGLEFGNTFVALQPPRGYDMDPNAVYHRPDLPPPHNYYALYRWLRDEWQADAIVHMGKHGTLEWLPGKGVGLGDDCFPDLFLGDLPLIYPFIINDPGEGNQAKRRTHAVIIDHMTPPMISAGAYGALAELAQLVDEYYTAEQLDPAKLPLLQRQIWDVLQRHRLDDDLQYILKADHGDHSHDWDGAFLDDGTPTAFAELQGAQVAHLLEDIEGYLCELTGAQIRDGLHILGHLPEGEQLVEMLYHLLKLPNVQAPSLPAAVAQVMGEDWAALQENPGARRAQVNAHLPDTIRTNADVIAWIEAESKRLLAELAGDQPPRRERTGLAEDQATPTGHPTWLSVVDSPVPSGRGGLAEPPRRERTGLVEQKSPLKRAVIDDDGVTAALRYATNFIIPKLAEGAHDEIEHLLHALNGGYIPPGPSGAPTRGMAHVLPTGRNFYAVDPRALPSMASWQVGQGLAADLIHRYQREEGVYPESVGISIWGTSAMRTAGDDIAQVLALLGVRPRWQTENRRVIGVEVIPLAELGRPRVDVVCRISGFFRDAFPHLITLLDQAVQSVIDCDEAPEMNFPRKHALEAEVGLRLSGLSEAIAAERARYRLFGCKPGSYGAGILPLIDAKNWQSDADFARAYLAWGGYAYGATAEGVPAQEEFAAALRGVQVATKNQDNREHDIFDSDDYLQYHGGMIATVRALTGKNPRRYFGDSSNPARAHTRDLREEARRVFRSRVVNPKWLASMRRHGYKGALEVAATVDYLFGYDATAQVLDDWMYHSLAEEYLRNEEMQQFFAESNPWAWQAISERLLEAVERGMWQDPDPADLELLKAAQAVGLQGLTQRIGIPSD